MNNIQYKLIVYEINDMCEYKKITDMDFDRESLANKFFNLNQEQIERTGIEAVIHFSTITTTTKTNYYKKKSN